LTDEEGLGRLSSEAIDDPAAVDQILRAVRMERAPLWGGVSRSQARMPAEIESIDSCNRVRIRLQDHGCGGGEPIFLLCMLAGRPHFFSTQADVLDRDRLEFRSPPVIYVGERRDRHRVVASGKWEVAVRARDRKAAGRILDRSPCGVGVELRSRRGWQVATPVRLRFRNEDGEHDEFGEVKNIQSSRPGWSRLGILLLPDKTRGRLVKESQEFCSKLEPSKAGTRSQESHKPQSQPLFLDSDRVPVVAFHNERQERIAAILDKCGNPNEGPVVIIPPAWGKTKETLLSLSAVIQSVFVANGESVSILRFDGVRRRGESFKDAECDYPGLENLRFTFSQAVADLRATVDFAREELRPSAVLIVTFSASSIEGRRVVADDGGRSIDGWISVVGAPDPQSLIRGLSGGVDYLAGYERGRRYGRREIQGLLLDIDRAARDAIENRLAFLDDARNDLARINIPITWIHGKYDAWLDVERARDILSVGKTRERRLIEIPTGHQLRTSREAFEVFQLIAC